MLRAVIFDLGGTLVDWPDWEVDIERRWGLSYNFFTARVPENHWPAKDVYIQAMRTAERNHWIGVDQIQASSTPMQVLQAGFDLLGQQVSEQELLVALDGYGYAVSKWAVVFPDAVETLLTLRKQGYKLALLSNTWWAAEWHNADLAAHGLTSLLDVVVYTSDLLHSKPHPSVFFEVTRKLEVEPCECVMVGDRMIDDVAGALGVGMRGVWRKNDYPWPRPASIAPSAVISQLSELPPLLAKWTAED